MIPGPIPRGLHRGLDHAPGITFVCAYGGVLWFFLGAIFVANAAFNNLGFPVVSTLFSWARATLGKLPS